VIFRLRSSGEDSSDKIFHYLPPRDGNLAGSLAAGQEKSGPTLTFGAIDGKVTSRDQVAFLTIRPTDNPSSSREDGRGTTEMIFEKGVCPLIREADRRLRMICFCGRVEYEKCWR
jgi:hypothetical protein